MVGTLRLAHPAPSAWRALHTESLSRSFTHHKEFFLETASQTLP